VLYSPVSYRFDIGNPITNAQAPFLWSAVNIQNTSDSQSAPITIEFYNRSTGNLDLSLDFTIPPGSAVGANTFNGGNFNWQDFLALTPNGNWDGSVKVISDNSIPLVGTGIVGWGRQDKSSLFALIPQGKASNTLFVPAQYRLDYGTGSFAQWSSLNLQNVSNQTVDRADLTIEYIDTNGNSVKTITGNTLPSNLAPGAAVGLNTNNGGDLAASEFNSFGFSFIGGIVVSSSDPNDVFVATSNIDYLDRASTYNAIPEP
jgi:hypothetical protein